MTEVQLMEYMNMMVAIIFTILVATPLVLLFFAFKSWWDEDRRTNAQQIADMRKHLEEQYERRYGETP